MYIICGMKYVIFVISAIFATYLMNFNKDKCFWLFVEILFYTYLCVQCTQICVFFLLHCIGNRGFKKITLFLNKQY